MALARFISVVLALTVPALPALAQWTPPETPLDARPATPAVSRTLAVATSDPALVDDERPPIAGGSLGGDEAAVSPGSRDVREIDANADRVILQSSAETHPAGTVFFSDYELVLLQAGYALTDDIQLSVSGAPPIVEDQPYFVDLSLKASLLRTDAFRVATTVSLTTVFDADGGPIVGARAGLVGQLCFTRSCDASLSAGTAYFVSDHLDQYVIGNAYLGLTAHVSSVVALLLEPTWMFVIGDDYAGIDALDNAVLSYGIRFASAAFAVDLAMVRPFGELEPEDDEWTFGFPFVSFTYRVSTRS